MRVFAMFRSFRPVLVVPVLTALAVACTRTPDEPVTVSVTVPPLAATAELAPFQPEFPVDKPVTVESPIPTPRAATWPDLRIDASSPDTLVRSLQAMEDVRTAEDIDALKQALVLVQMDAQQRIAQIAARDATPPQFSDQQLMEIVFSGIDGMTLEQVVEHAGRIASAANWQ